MFPLCGNTPPLFQRSNRSLRPVSIFVGNLPFRAEQEDIIELFASFGEVTNCSLPLERDTGRKRGFAFVEMADEATEERAIEGLQGTELMGRPLRINKAEPRGSRGGGGGGERASGARGWEDRSYGGGGGGGGEPSRDSFDEGRSRRRRGGGGGGESSGGDWGDYGGAEG